MKHTTAVAISGGVDSLMTAYLLKEQGQHVIGIHFITGFEAASAYTRDPGSDKKHNVLKIGEQLGIPVDIIDIRDEFQEKIVGYFCRSYQSGQTPNPCMHCNPTIKFGTILAHAHKLGAQKLATGHYARIKKDPNGHHHLLKGLDPKKDQSYFLARLTRQQLANACFPLGEMKKSDIQQMATQKGLYPVTRAESQDVCFIKDEAYAEFLAKQTGFDPQPGLIENVNGQVIGEHRGLHLFTIGQRRGINCPAAEPYYVVRLDAERNRLIVGSKNDLLSSECRVTDINWIGAEPGALMEIRTRVRYRSQEVAATVIPGDRNTAVVRFKEPQASITPGQGAVFYRNDEVLGAGWIEDSTAHRA
ncbi:tRNA-specific 2-thiouridylase MnmA (EC [Olavius sp. associated proteobacterium Delta 1]|nr:tRNA-specific 2-thiouridylase MnmA (EC [Olavius sp. associated proteobacterium Delta 1]